MKCENADLCSEYRWTLVGLVVDVPPGLLFVATAGLVLFWLPQRVLEPGVRERVLAICEANRIPVKRNP